MTVAPIKPGEVVFDDPIVRPAEMRVKLWLRHMFPDLSCRTCGGINDQLPMKCKCSICTLRGQMIIVDDSGSINPEVYNA